MKSLLGIAGHWRCCLYSVGRRQVSRRAGAGLQVGAVTLTSGHGGAVDETSRGEVKQCCCPGAWAPMMVFLCASSTARAWLPVPGSELRLRGRRV